MTDLFTTGRLSCMNFMKEQEFFDAETQGTIRFRGTFQTPKWDGVEDGEFMYVIESEDERLDRVADRFWGEDYQKLYWVIALRNNLDLPEVQLYKGQKLLVPSLNWIEQEFLTQAGVDK